MGINVEKTLRKYFPIFVLPTLLAFFITFLIPFFMGVFLSFTKFTTVVDAKWVGLDNYFKAFLNRDFLNALSLSAKFTVVSVITVNLFAFLLALVLTKNILGRNVFRTIFFMPNLIGGIVLGYVWQLIINGVLEKFGVTITVDPKYGFWGMIILINWQFIGYMMIIYIAGIQNVPEELIEAAKIDGATPIQVIKKVIIPMIMPSVTICMFMTISNSFKMFDQNLALTAGGPAKKTVMVALDIFNTFYGRSGWEGVGQAKAVIFFLVVAIISLLQIRLTRGKEVES
jgi:raffinose/stachyose/melibiose transport system permease protein